MRFVFWLKSKSAKLSPLRNESIHFANYFELQTISVWKKKFPVVPNCIKLKQKLGIVFWTTQLQLNVKPKLSWPLTVSWPINSSQQRFKQKHFWNQTIPFLWPKKAQRWKQATLYCTLRNQHIKWEISILLDKLREVQEVYSQPTISTHNAPTKAKIEAGCETSLDDLLVHRQKDLTKKSNTILRGSGHVELKRTCVFSVWKVWSLPRSIDYKLITRTAFTLVTRLESVKATMTPKELKAREINGCVYCCNKSCNREKCKVLDRHVTTPVNIYGCGKCGIWSLVHKVSPTIREHLKKRENSYAISFTTKLKVSTDRQLFNNDAN